MQPHGSEDADSASAVDTLNVGIAAARLSAAGCARHDQPDASHRLGGHPTDGLGAVRCKGSLFALPFAKSAKTASHHQMPLALTPVRERAAIACLWGKADAPVIRKVAPVVELDGYRHVVVGEEGVLGA